MGEKDSTDVILFKYRLLSDAVCTVVSRYISIASKDWCEPSVKSALEDLERLAEALDLFHRNKRPRY